MDLPLEDLWRITLNVSYEDLPAHIKTCSLFRQIVKDAQFWCLKAQNDFPDMVPTRDVFYAVDAVTDRHRYLHFALLAEKRQLELEKEQYNRLHNQLFLLEKKMEETQGRKRFLQDQFDSILLKNRPTLHRWSAYGEVYVDRSHIYGTTDGHAYYRYMLNGEPFDVLITHLIRTGVMISISSILDIYAPPSFDHLVAIIKNECPDFDDYMNVQGDDIIYLDADCFDQFYFVSAGPDGRLEIHLGCREHLPNAVMDMMKRRKIHTQEDLAKLYDLPRSKWCKINLSDTCYHIAESYQEYEENAERLAYYYHPDRDMIIN